MIFFLHSNTSHPLWAASRQLFFKNLVGCIRHTKLRVLNTKSVLINVCVQFIGKLIITNYLHIIIVTATVEFQDLNYFYSKH